MYAEFSDDIKNKLILIAARDGPGRARGFPSSASWRCFQSGFQDHVLPVLRMMDQLYSSGARACTAGAVGDRRRGETNPDGGGPGNGGEL